MEKFGKSLKHQVECVLEDIHSTHESHDGDHLFTKKSKKKKEKKEPMADVMGN